MYHQPWMETASSPTARWIYSTMFSDGYMGVSFFFILSGFILTYTYQERLRKSDAGSMKKFFIARFARIYPLHALTFLISLPIAIYSSKGLINSLVAGVFNASLLQSFPPVRWIYFSFNGPSWSISDETFFYALFPFLLVLTTRNLKVWIGAAIALFLVLLIAALQIPNTELSHWFFYIFPVTRLWDFLVGILLARLAFALRPRLQSSALPDVGVWAALGLLVVLIAFHNDVPQNLRWSLYYAPAFALLIFSLTFSKGVIARLLSQRWLVYLGEM
ncbi:acyltransferase [Deinococcus marmoris]